MGAEGSFEVFAPGEMEREYETRAGHGDLSLWKALEKGYAKAGDQLIQPPRSQYSTARLGPPTFSFVVDTMPQTTLMPVSPRHCATREDFVVTTPSHSLHGSVWSVASSRGFSNAQPPCVLYLHSNMGTRVDALAIRDHVLAAGFSLAAFDFGGSGKSTGTFITGGVREAIEVDYVLKFLQSKYSMCRFFLWGHSLGAATALLFMQQHSLTRATASSTAALDTAANDSACTVPSTPEPAAAATPRAELGLPADNTDESQSLEILAAVLDSPYTTLQDMTESLIQAVRASGIPAPAALLRLGIGAATRSIESRAGFAIAQVNPLASSADCTAPALFCNGTLDLYVCTAVANQFMTKYGGPCTRLGFRGDHYGPRPVEVQEFAVAFLRETLSLG